MSAAIIPYLVSHTYTNMFVYIAYLYIWHVCIYYISSIHHLWKKRVVMIECAIKICLNKERKEKGNHYFSLDFTEFIWMKSWTMCQCHHSHIPSCIHSRQGFHLGLWPFLNPLLILHHFVCVEVSLLCSLPTIVCAMVGSQVSFAHCLFQFYFNFS